MTGANHLQDKDTIQYQLSPPNQETIPGYVNLGIVHPITIHKLTL